MRYDRGVDDEALHHLWLDLDRDLAAKERELRTLRALVDWHVLHPGAVAPVDMLDIDAYVAALVKGRRGSLWTNLRAWLREFTAFLLHYRSHVAIGWREGRRRW